MTYSVYRPQGCRGQGDSHLPQILRRLQQVLSDTQHTFAHDSLHLGRKALGEFAGVLVDFAEDLHNHNGIWEAYERYNAEFFGTPLPMTPEGGGSDPGSSLHANRFHHFLWVMYPIFMDGLILAPTHQDLRRMAEASSTFLSAAFRTVPKDSGVKKFLQASNARGWEVKRKLVWLGSNSFMFRALFARYMDEKARSRADIGHVDDFICQECTCWSGLGAIDVLAGLLDISNDDREDLRSWYERHAAFYKLLSVSDTTFQALNVISDQLYRIRIDMKGHPFKAGQLLFGSLVPWRGEWYWSGEQKVWDDASKVDVDELKRTMKRDSSTIVCRYCKDYEAQVWQRARELHQWTLAFHGNDLIVYRDGLSMAADWQREFRHQWASKPQHEVEAAIQRHGLKKGQPEITCPKDLLEHKDGLGVFLHLEGKEIMTHFTTLVAGLKQQGGTLTDDQHAAIRGFLDADAVSPSFVKRVLGEYGEESVKTVFYLRGDQPGYWLEYLLRSRKGHFYRSRYPTLSVI